MAAPTTLPDALAEIEELRGQVRDLLKLLGQDAKPMAAGDDASPVKTTDTHEFSEGLVPKGAGKDAAQHLLNLHQMIETVPDIIFTLDLQGNLVGWNKRLQTVTGFTPQELNGRPALAFVPEHEHAQTAAAIQRAFEDGYAELEGHLLTKVQLTIPYHWTGAAFKNEEGRIIGITGVGRDVSEKRRIQAELQRQRQQLLSAQAFAHVGSWEWDISSGDMEWSEEQFRIFGHKPGTIPTTYEAFLAAVLPDDHDRVRTGISKTLKGQEPLDIECRIVRPSGEIRSIHCRGEIIVGRAGHPTRVSGSTLDITDRKQAELALQRSEAHFRALIEHSSDIITVLDLDGTIRFESPSFERLLGFAQHEIDGRIAFDFIHPEDLPTVLEKFQQVVQRPSEAQTAEFRFRHKDGSWLVLEGIGRSILDTEGQRCVIVNSRDVTERKRAQVALARSHDLLTSFVEHTPAAVAMLDKDLRYVAVSRRWVQDYRLGEQNLIGKHHYDVFPEIRVMEDWQAIHRRCLAGAVERCDEDRFIRADGSEDWLRWEVRPWREATGTIGGIIMFTEVITERKQVQEELKLFRTLLDQVTDSIEVIESSSGRFLDGNRQSYESIGYTRSELLALTVPDIDPVVSKPLFQEYMQRLREADAPLRIESVHLRKDGTTFPVEVVAQIIRHDREYLVAVVRDITARKKMEAALVQQQEYLRLFIEHSPVALAMFDPEMRYIAVSRRWQSDYDNESLIGRSHYEVCPEIPERWKAIHQRCLAGAVERCEEDAFTRADGRTDWTRWEIRPWLTADGSVGGVVIFAEDITARKQAEEMKRRLVAIVESSEDAIISTDLEGRVTSWNRGAEQLFGYAAAEMVGEPVAGLILPDRRKEEDRIFERVTRGESITHFETVRLTKHGQHRDVSLTLSSMRDEHGTIVGISKIAHDITERKRTENALRISQERYARATAIGKVGVWELDVATGLYHGDVNLKALFGYEPDELSTDPYVWLGLVHPEDQWIALKAWEGIVSGSTDDYYYELRMIRKDGTLIWTDVRGHAERDEHGHVQRLIGATVDITDRKQAEETLSESEARFRTLVSNIPGAIYRCDVDKEWTMSYLSKTIEEIVGYPAAEFIGNHTRSYASVIHPDDRQLVESTVWAGLRGRCPYVLEYRVIHANGTVRWVYEKGQGVFTSDGKARFLDGAIFDITERKQADELLRLTQFSVDRAVNGVFWVAPDGRILSVNEAACRMLEYSREELTAMTVHDIDPQFSPESWSVHWENLKQKESMTFESKHWSRTGRVLETEVTVNYLQYEGREYNCAIMRDISERKRAEAELRQSHAFIRQVIDIDPNFIFAKDRDGRFTLVNKAVAECYGTTVDELIGKSDADFTSNAQEVAFFRQLDLDVMDSLRERFIPEEPIMDSTGRVRWLQTVKRPILDDQGRATMVLGASTEITERKRVEAELRQREQDLRRAGEERERISEDLHDGILQSIYAIGLGLEACKPLVADLPKKSAVKLNLALQRTIGQLNHVLEEVRNFIAGLESQILDGQDFEAVLRTMVHTLAAPYPIPYRIAIEEAASQNLSTEQAYHVMNIAREALSNSLRHSGATRITVSLKRLRRSVRLSVVDNGVGFNPAGVRDVGHGLANMAARTQKIGGKLTLQSKARQGAKVLVDIPRRSTNADT
ncbi:MAG: PAS domain S-box protein [Nitrospira sp.]|nr:PAS domain S-box protein [Nitrospira sp.]